MMNTPRQPYVVTTSHDPGCELEKQAHFFSRENQILYFKREGSLSKMLKILNASGIFVFTDTEMYYWQDGNAIRFHTNMAKHRILNLKRTKLDRMQKAMNLATGDSLLDCTMGLATDAIVASYIVGPKGLVVALESELPIYLLVKQGLMTHEPRGKEYIIEPMRRIKTQHRNCSNYLKDTPDRSFDVVYFDPMFRRPQIQSLGLEGIRLLANFSTLTPELIAEAKRVAKRRVVLKERTGSPEFGKLGFRELPSGKGASLSYGIIEADAGGRF